jgi:hypothetical protein
MYHPIHRDVGSFTLHSHNARMSPTLRAPGLFVLQCEIYSTPISCESKGQIRDLPLVFALYFFIERRIMTPMNKVITLYQKYRSQAFGIVDSIYFTAQDLKARPEDIAVELGLLTFFREAR